METRILQASLDAGLDPDHDRPYWLAFRRVSQVGPVRLGKLFAGFGSLERAWNAPERELREQLDERTVANLVATRGTVDPHDEWNRVDRAGITALTLLDAGYPRLLREVPVPPPVLFVRGTLDPVADRNPVAMVGTRRLTSYGREMATTLASGLAEQGVTIVSGLARGIDAAAHSAALRAGGRTIAVLGCGVDLVYPPEHRALAEQVVEGGALVSDYSPGTKPDAPNFPARNRIISGMSLGVVVVEAPAKSGALITCDFAADQGREVFVVPGSALSDAMTGNLRLLRDGARMVRSAQDIMEDLGLGGSAPAQPVQQSLPLTDDERRFIALITDQPQHLDELVAAANLPVSAGSAVATMLELKGLVRNVGAQHYIRAR